jgi:phospholipase/carboxylesterase
MNRIQQFVDDELDHLIAPPVVAELATAAESQTQDAHCIVTPLHYERNYAYPLIVWLHGPGDDERQVTRVMPHISSRNYAAVGPRGTERMAESRGYRWSQNPADLARAEQRVLSAISAARNWLNIAGTRVYLAGFGCGGTMAFRIALAQPRLFAGVLSFGGLFPNTLRPLSELESARDLKMFIANGVDSAQYPQSEMCRNLRLFHVAGLSLCLRLYPCGDELLTNMLSDMDRWIMDQLTSPCVTQSGGVSERSPRQ